jgi:hypothetical protein
MAFYFLCCTLLKRMRKTVCVWPPGPEGAPGVHGMWLCNHVYAACKCLVLRFMQHCCLSLVMAVQMPLKHSTQPDGYC